MVLLILAAMSLASATPQTAAQVEARLSATYNECMDRSGGVTSEMLDCIGAEYDRQDAVLNTTYRALMARSDRAEKAELRNLQRAWIRAKVARCESDAADAGGGTLSTVVLNDCHLTRTVERVLWLENRASQ